jgi:hypothetical protein
MKEKLDKISYKFVYNKQQANKMLSKVRNKNKKKIERLIRNRKKKFSK